MGRLRVSEFVLTGTLTTNMMSVCKMFTFKSEGEIEEFEISGSTYEPIGDVFQASRKVKGSDTPALEEIATISVMCNDSAIDYNEYKNAFEKVGGYSINIYVMKVV